jgi:hypothetical protein
MTLEEAIIRMSQYRQRIIADLDDPPSLREYDHHATRFEEIDGALELMRQVRS